MSKSLRWSEKWFRRGLWLVALAFAWFLTGLGSALVDDLPRVEEAPRIENFIDQQAAAPLREALAASEATQRQLQDELDQAELRLQAASGATESAKESFKAWVATRQATAQPEQDQALIERTRALERLQATQREAEQQLQTLRQQVLDARQAGESAQRQLDQLRGQARDHLRSASRAAELRVFLYRLALTLPLLLVAGWLFLRKRKSTYWPFVWGFILFALFAFFVELVPYLPSYGGYVRYGVGIVLTVLVGRYAIVALNRYLKRQQQAEQMPLDQRRRALDYDTAQARLGKGVCPGCERSVDLKDGQTDFCPHCGIGLFDHCPACQARKSTFAHYCHACGAAAKA